MDTNKKRTPEEIRKAVYDVCGGDMIGNNSSIRNAQLALLHAIIWEECPPEEGWGNTYNRQLTTLSKISEGPTPIDEEIFFDLTKPLKSETLKKMMELLCEKYHARIPWDVSTVDEYIAQNDPRYRTQLA